MAPPPQEFPIARPARQVWLAAALAFAGAFAIYLAGAAPGLLFADSAEMQGLGILGGIAHPTGYPLFILVARVFGRLAPGEPAFRITLMSAFWAAASLGLLIRILTSRGVSLTSAFAAAMLLGACFTYWTTSQRAEVYSIAVFVALFAWWRTLVALDTGRDRDRLLAGLLLGLTMTGHWSFALPVGVCGLMLAWNAARSGGNVVGKLVALLLAFVLGLTPYLYFLWVQAAPHPFDYLRLVDDAAHPLGPRPPGFDTPLARLRWLLLGRNHLPAVPYQVSGRWLAGNFSDIVCTLGLFELGPIACALGIAGGVRQFRARPIEWALLACCCAASIVFTTLIAGPTLIGVFLLPCFLVSTWWIAWGFDGLRALLERRHLAPALVVGALLLLPVLSTVVAGGLRLRAYDHPVGPMHSSVHEEDIVRVRTLIPSMRHFDAPRRFVEAALPAIPDSALVVGQWGELMPMKFARYVEGRRSDLTYLPLQVPTTFPALVRWQQQHGSARPIVFLSTPEVMIPYVSAADTLALAQGSRLLVITTPQPGFEVRTP